MDTSRKMSVKNCPSSAPSSTPKNLVFDHRYGWVIDVWKDPSEEALSGGRGMFCIVPLTKALVKAASQTITVAANSTRKVLEKPELFSPQQIQANLNDQLKKITTNIKKPELDLAVFTGWMFSANPNNDRHKLN